MQESTTSYTTPVEGSTVGITIRNQDNKGQDNSMSKLVLPIVRVKTIDVGNNRTQDN